MIISETKIRVRYVETDQMGIVHHSNYYAWYEVGRTEFMIQEGFSYKKMEACGLMNPLTESHCKYIEGAKYEDDLIIQTWIEDLSGAKVVFAYNVIRESDEKVIAKGSTKHAFVNNDFKIINIKKTHPDIWSMFQRVYSK